jgi:hypothetical protein
MLPFCILRKKSACFFSHVESLVSVIFRRCADPDIPNGVSASVFVPCHDILGRSGASLFPFPAVTPDFPPLFEGKSERDTTVFGAGFVRAITRFLGVFASPCAIRSRTLFYIRLTPLAHIEIMSQSSAIFAFSHWFLSIRTVVRDGIGAATSMSFRTII